MQSLWQVMPADPRRAESLARGAGVHPLTAQLLLHRGVATSEQAARFFHPSLSSLEDPFALPDMEPGIARLRRAITQQEPIVIFGDSDVDGLTASVILYEALQASGAIVRAQQSNRIVDGYGLPNTLVRSLCRSAAKVVILVDCGTNQAEAIRQLSAAHIDTIVVDHHVPLEACAAPMALINPHRDPTGNFRELSSAGLAFKVAQALGVQQHHERWAASVDLAALGLLADYSPLVGESRAIVAEGLPRLLQTQRPGLSRLCEETRTTQADPQHILRQLVPRLNASGRLGDAGAVWHLLRRETDDRLEAWLSAAQDAHATTRPLHRQLLMEAQEQVHRMHFKEHYVLLVARAGWPQGLMGPVASQLSQRYGRPAFALALAQQCGIGSGRSIPLFNLLDALRKCEELLLQFGGHAQACGVTLRGKDVEPFREAVNQHARIALGQQGLLKTRLIDLEIPLEAVETRWVEELERFAPFGHGNARPTVLLRRLMIEARSPRMMVLSDGAREVAGRGSLPFSVDGGRYDVLASPIMEQGQVMLSVSDVKVSSGL